MKLEKLKEKDDLIMDVIEHDEFGQIRIAIGWDKGILYNAKDVAKALEYKDAKARIRDLVDETDKILLSNKNFRGAESAPLKLNNFGAIFITESGLYDLLLDSQMKVAKKFRKWITKEVIPSIRETGKYDINESKGKYKKSAYAILGKLPNKKFKESTQKKVSEISRFNKTLKGNVWLEFKRIYNLVFHTNLDMKRKNYIERLGCSDINTREYLDIMEEHDRALFVFTYMKIGANLSDDEVVALMEILDFYSEEYSELKLLQMEAKAKKFYEKNIKRPKKKKSKADVLTIEFLK